MIVYVSFLILILAFLILGLIYPVLKLLLYWSKEEKQIVSRIENIINNDHDPICRMCEDYIIDGSSNCWHFQCEGRFCEQAHEMFFEDKTNVELKELLK